MLGLGFDGVYRYNHDYIEKYMQLCMEKAIIENDIFTEPVAPPQKKKAFFQRQRKFTIRTAIIASAIFMLICFFINLGVFVNVTENYRGLLRRTAIDSAPRTYIQTEGGSQ